MKVRFTKNNKKCSEAVVLMCGRACSELYRLLARSASFLNVKSNTRGQAQRMPASDSYSRTKFINWPEDLS